MKNNLKYQIEKYNLLNKLKNIDENYIDDCCDCFFELLFILKNNFNIDLFYVFENNIIDEKTILLIINNIINN